MKDVMIDIETMGTKPGCPILSIGAVEFCRETSATGREYYSVIDMAKAIDLWKPDGDTVRWWMTQGDEARHELAKRKGVNPVDSLLGLSEFVKHGQVVWGNGSVFDITILEFAMRGMGVDIPWAFWNVRDVRTVVDLAWPICPREQFLQQRTGDHKALDDAKYQALYVSKMMQALSGGVK